MRDSYRKCTERSEFGGSYCRKAVAANELLSTFSISINRVVWNSVHEAARDTVERSWVLWTAVWIVPLVTGMMWHCGAFVSFVNCSVNSASGHGHDVTLWSFREFCDSRRCTDLRGVHGTAVWIVSLITNTKWHCHCSAPPSDQHMHILQ